LALLLPAAGEGEHVRADRALLRVPEQAATRATESLRALEDAVAALPGRGSVRATHLGVLRGRSRSRSGRFSACAEAGRHVAAGPPGQDRCLAQVALTLA